MGIEIVIVLPLKMVIFHRFFWSCLPGRVTRFFDFPIPPIQSDQCFELLLAMPIGSHGNSMDMLDTA